jgi:hypothetical protein
LHAEFVGATIEIRDQSAHSPAIGVDCFGAFPLQGKLLQVALIEGFEPFSFGFFHSILLAVSV